MKLIKRITIIFAIVFCSYILYCICPDYKFSKHQISDCGTLTVLTYSSISTKYPRTYFIPGNYNSLRVPKEYFYTYCSWLFFGYWEVLCSCRDGQIVIITGINESFEINEQLIKNYSLEKIVLERVEHKEFSKLKESGKYLYLNNK